MDSGEWKHGRWQSYHLRRGTPERKRERGMSARERYEWEREVRERYKRKRALYEHEREELCP